MMVRRSEVSPAAGLLAHERKKGKRVLSAIAEFAADGMAFRYSIPSETGGLNDVDFEPCLHQSHRTAQPHRGRQRDVNRDAAADVLAWQYWLR